MIDPGYDAFDGTRFTCPGCGGENVRFFTFPRFNDDGATVSYAIGCDCGFTIIGRAAPPSDSEALQAEKRHLFQCWQLVSTYDLDKDEYLP